MTLVEIAIVIALMALVMAFVAPRLLGADALGVDQQAKTTASGALDTITTLYAQDTTRNPWDPAAVDAKRESWEADPATAGTELAESETPYLPPRPEVSKAAIEGSNPDINVAPTLTQTKKAAQDAGVSGTVAQERYVVPADVAAAIPSTSVNIASTGSTLVGPATPMSAANSSSYYKVGVAVYAPSSKNPAEGVCWMAQRRMDGPAGPPVETYYLFPVTNNNPSSTAITAPDADQCSGKLAASLDYDVISNLSVNVVPGAPDRVGHSWGYPLSVTAAAVTLALTP